MLHELLRDGEEKEYIKEAILSLNSGEFRTACVAVRKALYVAIEEEYSVEEWSDYVPSSSKNFFAVIGKHFKAPFYTRNASWM